MFNEENHVVLLETFNDVSLFTVSHRGSDGLNGGIDWLLEALYVEEDREFGVKGVRPEVVAAGTGVVYNVMLNGLSVGFYGLKALVSAHPDLTLPPVIKTGRHGEIDMVNILDEYDFRVYSLPLFGEL